MRAAHCQRCTKTLAEVSMNSTGLLNVKCKKCGYMNRFILPDVDPRGIDSMKRSVAPPA
jgi:phage FluMu protein Com